MEETTSPAVTPGTDTAPVGAADGESQQQQHGAGPVVESRQSNGAGERPTHATPQAQPEGDSLAPVPPVPAAAAADASTAGEQAAPAPAGLTPEQLGRLRETLVAANPEAVAEMIQGADFDALLASVEGARAAYAAIEARVRASVATSVPRGGGARVADASAYEGLSPAAKIAAGIELAGRGHPA